MSPGRALVTRTSCRGLMRGTHAGDSWGCPGLVRAAWATSHVLVVLSCPRVSVLSAPCPIAHPSPQGPGGAVRVLSAPLHPQHPAPLHFSRVPAPSRQHLCTFASGLHPTPRPSVHLRSALCPPQCPCAPEHACAGSLSHQPLHAVGFHVPWWTCVPRASNTPEHSRCGPCMNGSPELSPSRCRWLRRAARVLPV